MLEMIVYIAILVLMLGVIMDITISIVRYHRIIKASRSIENSAITSFERITREVRKANSVDVLLSTFNSSPGKLTINTTNESGNPKTVEFYLESNKILLKENGVDQGSLSQSDSKVQSLIFRLLSGSNFTGVRAEMVVESGTSTYYRTGKFYTFSNLR